MSSTSLSIPLLPALQKVFSEKKTHLFLFFVINIVIGSAGIWLYFIPAFNAGIKLKFLAILRLGGAYVFIVAYLAATSCYVIIEYIEDRNEPFRSYKAVMVIIAVLLAVFCFPHAATLLAKSEIAHQSGEIVFEDYIQIFVAIISIIVGFFLTVLQLANVYGPDVFLAKKKLLDQAKIQEVMTEASKHPSTSSERVINGKKIKL